MEIEVRGKKLQLSKAVENYVSKKMGKLSHLLPSIVDTKVEITKEKAKSPTNRYVVQVTVKSDGVLIRAEERQADIYAAIDAADDVIRKQIGRFKGKYYLRNRRAARQRKELGVAVAAETGAEIETETEWKRVPDVIVKAKRFPVKLMSVEEASVQMELLGHDFFIFLNADTNSFNVLYRRKDGAYGLIEPEVA
ncbi:MAG TPA: ribosome-associated translation inhibitor RaiA [Dehalococcoidia bacterium]|nr:ribosome-associated translation inhibitor RaiA [Dehalococcoidia bacterium]